jgi:hypothetical protein
MSCNNYLIDDESPNVRMTCATTETSTNTTNAQEK